MRIPCACRDHAAPAARDECVVATIASGEEIAAGRLRALPGVNYWIAARGVTNTAIKAFCYWNGRAVGKYDYQIQRSCRTTLYGGAVATMANHPYFNQDTSLARF